MLRFARVWLLLAVPFWALAGTDLVEEWTPFARTLFYMFLEFGIFSLLLSLFEDSGATVPGTVVEPTPAQIIETIAETEPVPAMPAVPGPVVALALGVSTVAMPSSARMEVPVMADTAMSVGDANPTAV
jgi:hypothetical protein